MYVYIHMSMLWIGQHEIFVTADHRKVITLHLDGSGRSLIFLHTQSEHGWITRAIGSPEKRRACTPLKISVVRKAFCFAYTCQTRRSFASPSHTILHPHPFLFNLAIVMLMRSVSFMGGEEKGHIISREEGHVWM